MNPLRRYKDYSPVINDGVYIDSSAVLVGDITIGKDSSIWPFVAALLSIYTPSLITGE